MSFVIWDEKYKIGVKEIDEQHKKLVELINALFVKIYNGFNKDYHYAVLKEVIDYTHYHFDYEEEVIRKTAPEIYDQHKLEHDNFKNKISQYKDNINFDDKLSLLDFAGILKTWLLKHILGSDQEISRHII